MVNLFNKRNVFKIIICVLCLSFVASCGKKPNMVVAPPQVENDTYPRPYPAQDSLQRAPIGEPAF